MSSRSAQGAAAPSMLDLVRLSSRPLFPPGGEELYRQIALLTRLEAGQDVLVVACGLGVSVEYFVREFQVQGSGVDADGTLVLRAEARLKEAELLHRASFQRASPDRLPFRDRIFHVVVGELGLAAEVDPAAAIRELVRVLKPGGRVALVQLVWKAPVDAGRRDLLSLHLGARPLMLVEWRRLLREVGVEQVHSEDWSDEETAFRPLVAKPFPDFAEIFSLPEKLVILRRAWKRWGLSGVRAALARELEVHNLLTRERILGLDLLVGRKPTEEQIRPPPAGQEGEPASATGDSGAGGDAGDTRGLPLFAQEEQGQ